MKVQINKGAYMRNYFKRISWVLACFMILTSVLSISCGQAQQETSASVLTEETAAVTSDSETKENTGSEETTSRPVAISTEEKTSQTNSSEELTSRTETASQEEEMSETETSGSETETSPTEPSGPEVETLPPETSGSETVPPPAETTGTEPVTTPAPSYDLTLPAYNYGATAYGHVRTISDHFGWRVTGNPEIGPEQKDACGAWILQVMESYGYAGRILDWDHDNGKDVFHIRDYVFRKQGASEKRIVIGAHYDSRECHGAEDNGTGIGMVLELAERFAGINTAVTMEFCFWDGEELRDYAGSYYYLVTNEDPENIILYINLDCLGAGDEMYAYGGEYVEDTLIRAGGLRMAESIAAGLGIELHETPKGLSRASFRSPTRTSGSDQVYFYQWGIPYVFFEANAWVDAEGNEQHPNDEAAFMYNSRDPAFEKTEGQINHTEFDDLDMLESIVPGRVFEHMSAYSKILTVMLLNITPDMSFD